MDIYEKILTDQQKRMDREIGGTEGSGGKDRAKGTKNFFQLMAEILGQILGDKAADMMESMERLKPQEGQKVDPNAYGESIDDQQKFKTETDNQAHAFSIAQTDYQAETQMYSMLQNVKTSQNGWRIHDHSGQASINQTPYRPMPFGSAFLPLGLHSRRFSTLSTM